MLCVATLEVTALTKRYGSARGIEDVTFSLGEGEVFGYVGPNGSGKTTTIRCIMGLLRPTRGEVRVLGLRVGAGRATGHGQIGYLPGDFRTWPGISARRALRLLATLGHGDPATARREELAARLDLDLERPVGDLSKGNRQKVGVVYALQNRPRILILDEPTIGLDPLVRRVVLDLIREAAQAGTTVLLCSHDLGEVEAVCGRVGIVREGRLVDLGSIAEIVGRGPRQLKVWFQAGASVPQVPVDRLPGVQVVEQGPDRVHVVCTGSPDPVLKWISQFPVDRISTPETSLEQAFMRYYAIGDEGRSAHGRARP